MTPRTLRVLLLLVLALAGCSLQSPSRRSPDLEVQVPDTWLATEAGAGPVDGEWWKTFGSEKLSAVIEQAIAYNRDLRAAAARIEIAAAEARIAGADLYPQLRGSFDSSRQRQNIGGAFGAAGGNGSTRIISNSFGVALNVSWELDVWGRIRSRTRAAIADLQATQADWVAARLSVAGQTSKAWFSLTEAQQQVALTERTVESYRETARIASNRVDAGVQPPGDKHLAINNLASAEGLLQRRREAFERTRRQLEILLGRYPAGAIEGEVELPEVPAPPPAGMPAEVIRRRPDIVVAERQLASAEERIDSARADLYPRFSLTGNGGLSSGEFRNLFSGDNLIWTIAGNIIQPIFEGGRLRAQIRANEGRAGEALASFAQRALVAFSEVESALAAERLLAEREAALALATEAAQAAVEVARNRYLQGIETFIVVLESQRRALDAESAWLEVRRQRLDNRVDLHLGLGGGFEADLPPIP